MSSKLRVVIIVAFLGIAGIVIATKGPCGCGEKGAGGCGKAVECTGGSCGSAGAGEKCGDGAGCGCKGEGEKSCEKKDCVCKGEGEQCCQGQDCEACPESEAGECKLEAKEEAVAAEEVSLPTMLELGSESCVPCKAMMPIVESLQQEYYGQMNVEFHDVWKDNSWAEKYQLKGIPTQIFLDKDGKEIFRHVGFFAREDILAKWAELGVELKAEPR